MKIDKFEIKPHEFRHPIEIQRCVSGTDNDNIPVEKQWNKLIKTRAKIVTNKTDEENMMSGKSGIDIKTFYIRGSRSLEITSKDRIVYNNKIYNIKSSNNIQQKCIYIEIKAEFIG